MKRKEQTIKILEQRIKGLEENPSEKNIALANFNKTMLALVTADIITFKVTNDEIP